MADSIHTQILTALVSLLNGITVANGYNSDLAEGAGGGGAFAVQTTYQELGDGLPAVEVELFREQKELNYAGIYDCEAGVHLLLTVGVPSGSTPVQTAVQLLIDDVEKILSLERQKDPILGLAAVQDILLQGHTKLPRDEELDLVEALVEVQVHFQHSLTDPTSAT